MARRKREGFGSVRKLPSGRWRATYRADGVEHRAPDTFRTAAEAGDWLSGVRADISRGTWINPEFGRYTVKEVGAKWLRSDPSKTVGSVARDESTLRLHVYPSIGDMPISAVKRGTVQELVNSWKGSVETIRRQYATLRALFNFAESYDWVVKSPCRGIKLPEKVRLARHALTDSEVINLASAVGEEFEEAILIGALAGLRWNEVFGLHVGDVDLAADTLRVSSGLTRSRSGASVRGRVGSRKARPRTEAIPTWLRERLAARVERLEASQSEALLFPDTQGNLVRYTNWRRRTWLPALEAAGLGEVVPRAGFHDLRRYHASVLVAGRVDSRTIMNRMGHTTAKLTFEVYAQPDAAADRAAAEQTGARLLDAMSHASRT